MVNSDQPSEDSAAPLESNSDPIQLPAESTSPQQLAEQLGPFDPPDDFEHGEEFEDEPPRCIPRFLKRGSFNRRRRGYAIIWAALGATFAIVSPWAVIQTLSLHFLPLAYLGWIGAGMIGISLLVMIGNWFSRERFEYVISGTPIVGRILSIDHYLTKTINAETKQETINVQYLAQVEYDNPETGDHQFGAVITPDHWEQKKSPKYALTIAPGEYVTLVGMPGKISETLRLYGFLGLDPNREYLTYRGKPLVGTSPLTAILIASLVFAGLWLFVGFFWTLTFCIPEEWNWPLGLTAMGIGGLLAGVLGWLTSRAAEKGGSTESNPVVAALAFGFFGVLLGGFGVGLCNAVLDHSDPTYVPVTIENHWQKTHKLMFRDYEVEYTEFGNPKSQKKSVAVENLWRLGSTKVAVKEIRKGALGLKWIAGFHPIRWVPMPTNPTALDQQRAVAVDARKLLIFQFRQLGLDGTQFDINQIEIPDEKKEVQVIPVVYRAEHSYAPAPEEVVQRVTQELKNQTN